MRFPIPSLDDVVSLEIESSARGYGPAPEPGDELRQTFKVSTSGYTRFTRLYYGSVTDFKCYIDKGSSAEIIEAVVDSMSGPICDGCDMRVWSVKFKTRDGRSYEAYGSIDGKDLRSGRFKTSALIRRILRSSSNKTIRSHLSDIPEMILFDGGERLGHRIIS